MKKSIYIYKKLNHFAVHQKLTQHCKSTILQFKKIINNGNSLEVQWSGLGAFTAVSLGPIPGQGTKIPQASQRRQKN